MIGIAIENQQYKNHIEYTFTTLFQILGFKKYSFSESGQITIFFGTAEPSAKNCIWIKPSSQFWDNFGKPNSIPQSISFFEQSLPCIFCEKENTAPSIKKIDTTFITNIDIIAAAFFMLSRYEEYYQPRKLDKHHRFPAAESAAFKLGFIDKPIVNIYAELLKKWLIELGEETKNFNNNFWASKEFAFCMTHDIDTIAGKPWWDTIKDDLKNILKFKMHGFLEFFIHNIQYLLGKNPAQTFPFMLKKAKKYFMPSTYFFMTHCRTHEFDVNEYDIYSDKTKKLFKQLKDGQHEISLHSSYNSFDKRQYIQEEYHALLSAANQSTCGIRQHYLRFEIPQTLVLHAEQKIFYDSTLGYADHEGFRCGTCHPFQPFDLRTKQVIPIWELPLMWMDGTLLNYRKLDHETIVNNFKYYLDTIEKYHGIFIILFHNTGFSHQEERVLYEKCLKQIKKKNALLTTLSKALKLFRNS